MGSVAETTTTTAAEGVERFVRSEQLEPGFSVAGHVAKVGAVAAAICGLGAWLAWTARPIDWLVLPLFWVIANFFEWGIHRYPMHRPMFPRYLYRGHSLVHHRAFARADDMAIDDVRELSLVMMPWYTLVFVFVSASPVAVAAWLLGGRAFAGIFLVGSVAYFLFYEVMHTLHHLPPRTLRRLGLADNAALRRFGAHHAHHHELRRMAHVNFNVTVPLADLVLGTHERPGA